MRGRFKEYSGDEVKGINLVNLMLYTPTKVKDMELRSEGNLRFDEWIPMLNTLELESEIYPNLFSGNRVEKVQKAIDIFIHHASKSELPQMNKLVTHLRESIGKQSIEKAIEKGDHFLEKFFKS